MLKSLSSKETSGTNGAVAAEDSTRDRLESYRLVYIEHEAQVRRTLIWLVGRTAADDLVQETFIRVWDKWHGFKGQSSAKTWIYRIAVNLAYDHMRREKRRGGATRSADEAPEEAASGPGAENDMALKQLIAAGLQALPPKQRVVFALFYQQELEIEEIARTLRLPKGTVKSRLFHARSAFTDFLKKNGVESHETA